MKGFYSPINRAAEQLPRTKGTGAEFMTELSKRPGYKPQEAQDRELQTLMALPKMERAQFLTQLKSKPAPKLEETTLTNKSGRTKYDEYSLPGGSNYREILLRMPHDEQRAKEFSDPSSGHWDQPNVLAHVRAKDRTGPNGEKILHLEEIQSDWHQQGRDRGYATPEGLQQFRAAELAHRRLKEQLEEAKGNSANIDRKLSGNMPLYQDPEVRQRMEAAKVEHNNRIMDLMPQVMKAQAEAQDLGHKLNNVVPNAPFKKNWHELALKKMIHHAAANGYDSIAITPGQEQAKRYDLSKHINAIEYERSDDGNRYTLSAIGPHGNRVHDESGIPISRVEELVGKEMANKIENNVGRVNNENYLVKTKNGDVVFETKSIRDAKEFARVHPETTDVISSNDLSNRNGLRTLSGLDLQVGGEGMKGFYDKMIPSFLNQFGKKYGAQVQPGSVSIISTPAQHHGLTESQFQTQSPEEQQRMVRQHAYAHQGAKTEVPVHHFPITPQMREDVTKNGVPLYADGGEVKRIYHGSHNKNISEVKDFGVFGGLFGSPNKQAAESHGPHLHYADIPEHKILTHFALNYELPYAKINQALIKASPKLAKNKKLHDKVWDVVIGDKGQATHHLGEDELSSMFGTSDAGEVGLEAQRLRGQVSKHLGYHAVELEDEHGTSYLIHPGVKMEKYAKGGSVEDKGDVPRETVKAYKLFRVHPKHPGKLFPLFVDANTPVEMNKWIDAKEGEMAKGKVKSKIGPLAYRPGWHAGDLPIATHIGEKSDSALTAPDVRPENHAWAEVEMPNDVDWQSEATKRGTNAQGRVIPVRAHITDQIPKGGHYRYKTNPNMTGNWLIGGSMKVNRVLADKEVAKINKAAGLADLPRAQPFKAKKFGFAGGGTVGPEEWMAEEHVNHKAKGGSIKPVGYTKEKVTVSPNLDQMHYELINVKRFKKAK